MREFGIVRNIDDLGRLVFPKELRKLIGWKNLDSIEFMLENKTMILKKMETSCILCGEGEAKRLISFKGHKVCIRCAHEVGKITGA